MPVLIAGVTPNCCNGGPCVNQPIQSWGHENQGTIGTFANIANAGLRITAASTGGGADFTFAFDHNTVIKGGVWSFEGTIDPVTASPALELGLGIASLADQVSIIPQGANWALFWSVGGLGTTRILAAPQDGNAHHFRVTKKGNNITVWVDGLPSQSFPLDARFPFNSAMHPIAGVSSLTATQADFYDICYSRGPL